MIQTFICPPSASDLYVVVVRTFYISKNVTINYARNATLYCALKHVHSQHNHIYARSCYETAEIYFLYRLPAIEPTCTAQSNNSIQDLRLTPCHHQQQRQQRLDFTTTKYHDNERQRCRISHTNTII